ncbi:MAG: phospho-sugar mutase [Ruminococcaceae bacterium]|nr:phospho-sugar mutase [Oscillospiraceae bacterium]
MYNEFKKWLNSDKVDDDSKKILLSIKDDETAIAERFAIPMSFGTAGLRSTMDVGISKMNVYTVAQTTQGLAELVISANGQERGVAVCYDSRNNSDLFAKTAASVLTANGIKVYLFDGIRPTPELSFAILHYNCIAGINVTASHNPKEYNGYKVYWEDGAQLPPEHASVVSEKAAATDIFDGVKKMCLDEAEKKGLLVMIGDECDEAFLKEVLDCRLDAENTRKYGNDAKLAYTALHGTGYKLVPEALKRCGIDNLITVESQMIPDGDFPTVASPNPENRECFEAAIAKIDSEGIDCGAIIATDPDADRIGLAIKNDKGEFFALNGNQIGALLIDHIIKIRKKNGNLPENACAIKSVVSSNLFDAICEKNGVRHISVLTGFKYIGEKIKLWATDGSNTFIFGYEESQGYLSAGYARDKDAVGASVLVAEMVCRHYAEGRTVYEALQSIYNEYGIYKESVLNVKITGIDPMGLMSEIMAGIRKNSIDCFGGLKVTAQRDYSTGIIKYADGSEASTGLPASNMLYYELEGGSAVIIRPSGTEPKIKAYILVRAESEAEANELTERLTSDSKQMLNK